MNFKLTSDCLERTARIFNIQKYNVHDGPGIRTLVFFKGCPLRCKWCSNPEGLTYGYSIMMKKTCVNCGACVKVCPQKIHQIENGVHFVDRTKKCIGCRECEKSCLNKAIEIVGEDIKISRLIEIIEEDRDFYRMSGGGLTVGGGECSSQTESLISLLAAANVEGINTAIETCGYVDQKKLEKIKEYVDLFLFDIKHMDPIKHKELTGVSNEIILSNLVYLIENGKKVKVRMPLLNNVNSVKEEIMDIIKFIEPYKFYKNFEGVDLLPYHKFGVGKYEQLDMKYPMGDEDFSLSESQLKEIEDYIKKEGVNVNLVKH